MDSQPTEEKKKSTIELCWRSTIKCFGRVLKLPSSACRYKGCVWMDKTVKFLWALRRSTKIMYFD